MTTTRHASPSTSSDAGNPASARAVQLDRVRRVLVAVFPFLLALMVGAVVLLAAGHNPLSAYALMAREALGSGSRIAATLAAATPLLFTGLATAVAFRTGIFNIGVEGSFVAGGLTAAVVGFTFTGLPGPLLILTALAAATVVGTLVTLGPGLLRAHWGVDEVVTTLMANFVVIGLCYYLVNTFLLAPGVANNATPLIADHGRLPRLLPPSTLHFGLLIALAAVIAYGIWLKRTPLGYEIRIVGINPEFSMAQGVNVARVIVMAMVVSGAIGGLGGAAHTLGVMHRFVEGFSPEYGFTGIAVALLGRNSAIGVVLASLLFGGLASAGSTMQLFSDIPVDLVRVLQGVVMIFAVVQIFTDRRRVKGAD